MLLPQEHEDFKQTVRKFSEENIAPQAKFVDDKGEFIWDNVKELAKKGYLGMTIPEKYGGSGGDTGDR